MRELSPNSDLVSWETAAGFCGEGETAKLLVDGRRSPQELGRVEKQRRRDNRERLWAAATAAIGPPGGRRRPAKLGELGREGGRVWVGFSGCGNRVIGSVCPKGIGRLMGPIGFQFWMD